MIYFKHAMVAAVYFKAGVIWSFRREEVGPRIVYPHSLWEYSLPDHGQDLLMGFPS
jgi:hypothetical protein